MNDEAVIDNGALHRYELVIEGTTAFVNYHRTPRALVLTHAEVPGSLRGRGHGTRLVRAVLSHLRAQGEKIVPQCPFIAAYMERHREFDALLA
jgi:predicted GNAT family acetyltransferase